MPHPRKARGKAKAPAKSSQGTAGQRRSQRVMQTSNALDLEKGVFGQRSPRQIALSLKHSAESSRRRNAEPYASAMSMLNFHINRTGRQLSSERRRVLEKAKDELRKALPSRVVMPA